MLERSGGILPNVWCYEKAGILKLCPVNEAQIPGFFIAHVVRCFYLSDYQRFKNISLLMKNNINI
jgi:hypothetical protein